MFVFIYRAFKFAFQGFFRNIWLSIVTIVILVLMLFSITMVIGINFVADKAIDSVKNKVDVSVYINDDISEDRILSLRHKLEEQNSVKEVEYISEEEALAEFKDIYSDNTVILESLDLVGDNPLSATLIVKAKSIEEYQKVISFLTNSEYDDIIEKTNFDDNEKIIDKLSEISSKLENIGIYISIIFAVISILIIFNTIRINIYTHREEIGIMKLVGATNWFVRTPFLIESILYALIAVIITMSILYPLMGVIAPQVTNFFEGYNLDLVEHFNTNFWQIIFWQLGFAIVLSIISSSIAIGRYLRV